tara:strand:+ start:1127 stop:1357 length:231 start_codon:yes stop_codon:yes gene_type:complete
MVTYALIAATLLLSTYLYYKTYLLRNESITNKVKYESTVAYVEALQSEINALKSNKVVGQKLTAAAPKKSRKPKTK